MNTRRGFFRFLALAPAGLPAAIASAKAAKLPTVYTRLSSDQTDPGYLPYLKLIADYDYPIIYLDGVEQNDVTTVDAMEGWVRRAIKTDNNHYVIDHIKNVVMEEVVYGNITISYGLPKAQS